MKYHKRVWDADISGIFWIMSGKFRTLAPAVKKRGGCVVLGRGFFLKEPIGAWMWLTMDFGVSNQWGIQNLQDRKKVCNQLYKRNGRSLMRCFYRNYPE